MCLLLASTRAIKKKISEEMVMTAHQNQEKEGDSRFGLNLAGHLQNLHESMHEKAGK